ncbi:MAG: hypothetical protein WED09_05370 [Homoserinimonas sp.]
MKISAEDRQFLVEQLAKLTSFLEEVNYVGTLPGPLHHALGESKHWVTAGIRHADGKHIALRHLRLRADLPTERVLMEKSKRLAKGVDQLIEDCRARKPKNQQKVEDKK